MCKVQQRPFFKTRRNIGIDGYSSEIINTLVEDEYKTWEPYEEEINGKIIQVDVAGEYSSNDVMLKKADGQQYFIAQNEHGC